MLTEKFNYGAVSTPNSYDMVKRFPNATLHIYEEAAHGAVFQHHYDFVRRSIAFFKG